MLEVWQLIRGMDPAGLLFISIIGYMLERRQRGLGERLAHVEAQRATRRSRVSDRRIQRR